MANTNELPDAISNMDVVYVDRLLVDFHYQLAKASAADQSDGFSVEADMVRLEDRIGDLSVKTTFLAETPLLDAPETQGRTLYEVPLFEEVPEPSNRDVIRLMHFIELIHREITHSQSARLANGIAGHDAERMVSYIANLEGLVTNYIKLRTPNDHPEVSPKNPQVGPGR